MAYTRAPMENVEQNKQISLLYQWDSRFDASGNYDTLFQNALIEPIGQEYFQVLKRDGIEQVTLPAGGQVGPMIGTYFWDSKSGNPFIITVTIGASNVGFCNVYNVDPVTGTIGFTSSTSLANTVRYDTEVFFEEFLYDNGTVDLFFTIPAGLYRIVVAGTVTGPVPTGIAAGGNPVFLDGYLFLCTNSDIFNSNLNDPLTWSASNFISVESYPDKLRMILRVGTYIVALGTESTQYFYNAANPTGTPLAANVGATKKIGLIGGLTTFGDQAFFIGTSGSGAPSLYTLQGLKIEELTSYPFSRFWVGQGYTYDTGSYPKGSILLLNGHSVYYVHTPVTPSTIPPTTTPTGVSYYYDLETKLWSKLTYQSTAFLLTQSAWSAAIARGFKRQTYFNIMNDNNLYRFSPTIYRDNGVNFEVKFRTRFDNYGTQRMKFGNRLVLVADMTSSASNMTVSWTDNDFQSFTATRTIALNNAYQQLYALGAFRARGWEFTYADNFPMRWRSVELDYTQGQS